MTETTSDDSWSAGQSYERYMGRWSRQMAARFLDWLAPPRDADWLEIGCGTGALTETVLAAGAPRSVLATDQSADFVSHAQSAIDDARVRFEAADARSLPVEDASVDVVTSAIALNFVPDMTVALAEMQRVLRPGGLLSFYVWDYPGGGVGMIDVFWKAAAEMDPEAADLDEARRFPFCTAEGLAELCDDAGVPAPQIAGLEITTAFADFEAFWQPFTLGAGPAPAYCVGLPPDRRQALKARLAETLGSEGPLRLTARAWAVKATIGS